MRKIGRDIKFTDAILTKRSIEKALLEARGLLRWICLTGRDSDQGLVEYAEARIAKLSKRLDKQNVTLELIKRYAGEDCHFTKTGNGVRITDHGIIRYLERHMGIDLGELAENIVTPEVERAVKGLVNGRIAIPGSECVLVFKNSTIVTVITKEQRRTSSGHKLKGKKKKRSQK